MMKKISILVLSLTITACVTTKNAAIKITSKYVGQHVDVFFVENGAPATEYTMSDGRVAYLWKAGIEEYENYSGRGWFTSSSTVTQRCEISIITNKKKIITKITPKTDSSGGYNIRSQCADKLGIKAS